MAIGGNVELLQQGKLGDVATLDGTTSLNATADRLAEGQLSHTYQNLTNARTPSSVASLWLCICAICSRLIGMRTIIRHMSLTSHAFIALRRATSRLGHWNQTLQEARTRIYLRRTHERPQAFGRMVDARLSLRPDNSRPQSRLASAAKARGVCCSSTFVHACRDSLRQVADWRWGGRTSEKSP